MAEAQPPIYLTLLNGTGYVFNVDDYMKLRSEHRIIGAMVGTCNMKGWAANETTLPVELTPYETRLLVKKKIACLVSKGESLLCTPTPIELESYKQQLESRLASQATVLKSEKLRETERNMEKILAGKRRKMSDPSKMEQRTSADVLKEIEDNFVFSPKHALLEIPFEHMEPHTAKIVNLDDDTSLKYRVYEDLWSRGKYVTTGEAFGGDFLVYPGDPLLYHASYIVTLLPNGKIPGLELITKSRLSVTVNKICTFAYFDEGARDADELPAIRYATITWKNSEVAADDDG